MLGLDGLEELGQVRGLARVEAGRRLVEAQQRRLGAHGARDLEPPLGAVGQVAGRIVGAVGERHLLEPELGALHGRRLGLARSAWRRRGPARSSPRPPSARCAGRRSGSPAPSCPGNRRMFWNVRATRARAAISWSGMRSSRNTAPAVGLARATAGGGERCHVGRQRCAAEAQHHAAAGRLVESGDAVEDRGLAGAVGADDGGDLARLAEKERSSMAISPPKRMVRCSTASSGTGADGRRGHQPCPSFTTSARTRRRSRRKIEGCAEGDEAARLPDHQQHHAEAEQQHAILRRLEIGAEHLLEPVELAQDLGAADHGEGGDGDADLAAHAPQHDDRQHHGALHEGEGLRADEALACARRTSRRSRRSRRRWQRR